MSGQTNIFIDPKDLAMALNDLGKLGTNVTRKRLLRRALVKSGSVMKSAIERKAFNAIMDHGEMSESFAWRSSTKKRGSLHMFIRSIVAKGGKLTSIFEGGTTDRYHKSGWWTGKIENGAGKTTGSPINTKFIQEAFDTHKRHTGSQIVRELKILVTKEVAKSKKLNNNR